MLSRFDTLPVVSYDLSCPLREFSADNEGCHRSSDDKQGEKSNGDYILAPALSRSP